MKALKDLMLSRGSNWAILLLSVALFALAISNWTPPSAVVAQGGDAPRRQPQGMGTQSKQVLTALQDAFVNIAEEVEPSVVTIQATAVAQRPVRQRPEGPGGDQDQMIPPPFRDFFRGFPGPDGEGGPGGGRASTGSGVIIKASGNTAYVLTNNHVIAGRDKFRLTLVDGAEVSAELVGKDEKTDLAVLKMQTPKPLPPGHVANFGDSDQVKVGQWAVAIGSPLGYRSTLTVGVISAKGRELERMSANSSDYTDLIQTDASINPGNSGGALVNIDGNLIGINVAIASSGFSQGNIGIGFAIPSNTAKYVSDSLISGGKVTRGYLGVSCSRMNRELSNELKDHLGAPQGGALAESVQPNTPAAKAGLKDGDVITSINNRTIRGFSDLEKVVSTTRPGASLPVEVIRERKPVRLNITLAERPSESQLQSLANNPGGFQPLPGEPQVVKSRFGLSVRSTERGVEVAGADPNSPAFDAGLASGDVILNVGGQPTPNLQSFQKAMEGLKGNEAVVVRLRTANGLRFAVIRP